MDIVDIFVTDDAVGKYENFVHDLWHFKFGQLTAAGPEHLVDGPMWAFVDWVMDDLSGLEMCRRLRADPRTQDAHITVVLEDDIAEDRRRALRAGADDYIVGPVDRTVILDRVLALQADGGARMAARKFERGDLTIDMTALQARWAGQPIDLRPNEFRLLRFLAENANCAMTRAELIGGLGKQEPAIDERTVDVWVGRLRRALRAAGAGHPVRTVRSIGYVLDLG